MILSLNADTQGLFKKYGEKNLFQEWKLPACPADNHTIFSFPITMSFPSKDSKIASSRFLGCSTLWRISENGYLFPLHSIHRIVVTLLFFTLSLFTSPMSRTGVPALQTVPSSRRKVLWASCRKDSLLPSDNPVPLFPLRVDAWHSSGSAASLPKLAARFQGQQSPLCTGVKWVFFNSSEYLQWLNQFVPR